MNRVRSRRFWIILGTTLLLVLAVGTGVGFANQQHQTQVRDDHVAACEEMHAHMHGAVSEMPEHMSDMSDHMDDTGMQSGGGMHDMQSYE